MSRISFLMLAVACLLACGDATAQSQTFEASAVYSGYAYNYRIYNRPSSTSTTVSLYGYSSSSSRRGVIIYEFDVSGLDDVGRILSTNLSISMRRYRSDATEIAVVGFDAPDASGDVYSFLANQGTISSRFIGTSYNIFTGADSIQLVEWFKERIGVGNWLSAMPFNQATANTSTYQTVNFPLNGLNQNGSSLPGGVSADSFVLNNADDGRLIFGILLNDPVNTTSLFAATKTQYDGSASARPSLTIEYYPKLSLATTTAPDTFTGIPYEIDLNASKGVPPYTFSIDRENSINADWLALTDPSLGTMAGTPGFELGGKNVTLAVQVQDAVGQIDTANIVFRLKEVPGLPFVDGFETPGLTSYSIVNGPKARAESTGGAITNPANSSGGAGLMLHAADLNGWAFDLTDPNDVAIIDDPDQWLSSKGSAHAGEFSWFAYAPTSKRVDVSFDYKIVNERNSPSNKELYVNAYMEWSEDLGATWSPIPSTNTNANGIYRDDTAGNFVTESFSLNTSGDQEFVNFRIRWLVEGQGDVTNLATFFAMDDLEITSPLVIESDSSDLGNAQVTVPYERLPKFEGDFERRWPLIASGGDRNYSFSFGLGGTSTATLSSNGRAIEFAGNNMALQVYADPATGETHLRVPFALTSQYDFAPLPGAEGDYNFELICFDTSGQSSSKIFDLRVLEAPPSLSIVNAGDLPSAAERQPYTFRFSPYGGVTPYAVNVTSPLPSWLSFDVETGLLAGTPPVNSASEVIPVSVQITDDIDTVATGEFTLRVVSTLEVAVNQLPRAKEGDTYRAPLFAAGGTPPYSWSLVSGLPVGMDIDPTSGRVFGSPARGSAATSPADVLVEVVDANGLAVVDTVVLPIDPATSTSFSVTTPATGLPQMAEQNFADVWLEATAGSPPYTWSAIPGSMPVGLSLSDAGRIVGTPVEGTASQYTVNITIRDANNETIIVPFEFNISALVLPVRFSTEPDLPARPIGQFYVTRLQVIEGQSPFTFVLKEGSSLPDFLQLDEETGLISGLPELGDEGNYSFTAVVTDSGDPATSAERTFTLAVELPSAGNTLSIVTPGLPNAQVNENYDLRVYASGGQLPYTWSVISGNLPNGLNFNTFGTFSGFPIEGELGTFPVTIEVRDAAGYVTQRNMQLTVIEEDVEVSTAPEPINQPTDLGAGGSSCSVTPNGRGTAILLVALLASLVLFVRRRGKESTC